MQHHETEHDTVRNLQTYLRQLSYHDPSISPPPIDGVFGNATRQSLCEFQKQRGLPVTGTATPETWDALYEAYRVSLMENAQPCRVAIFPPLPKGFCLSKGSQDFSVSVLQYMLLELQYELGDDLAIEVNGVFDDMTEEAVKHFQCCCNDLECNGKVDRRTWDAITARYNALAERPFRE